MLNTSAANADAHAKNYSLMLGGQISVSPMYDVLCTGAWGSRFDDTLAIPIETEDDALYRAGDMTPRRWETAARIWGLDPELVVAMARTIAAKTLEASEQAFAGDDGLFKQARAAIADANANMEPKVLLKGLSGGAASNVGAKQAGAANISSKLMRRRGRHM